MKLSTKIVNRLIEAKVVTFDEMLAAFQAWKAKTKPDITWLNGKERALPIVEPAPAQSIVVLQGKLPHKGTEFVALVKLLKTGKVKLQNAHPSVPLEIKEIMLQKAENLISDLKLLLPMEPEPYDPFDL